jgi:phospholipase C
VRLLLCTLSLLSLAGLIGCQGVSHPPVRLTVTDSGNGKGTVTSSPAGISSGTTCTASFTSGTSVVLTATPTAGATFNGWSGACSGKGTCNVVLNASTTVGASFTFPPADITVSLAGRGSGIVTSSPAGINCPQTCTANLGKGAQVTLTATPAAGFPFAGWSGACSGTSTTCKLTLKGATAVIATFNGSLQSLNHIIFLAQENRSLDHYFGALRQYWAQNGFPDQAFDGLSQFNIPAGNVPTNPGCEPTSLAPHGCNAGGPGSTPVPSFHLLTQCIENPSPSWNESHVDRNLSNPVAANATMDGFVQTAANDARQNVPPYLDVDGYRAMGFYDGTDLNHYYFMASSFATSDSWFSPVMSRTQPNRMYLAAATSQGHVYPPNPGVFLTANTIFQELQNAGLSWKIYVNSAATGCADTDSACLSNFSEITWFTFGQQMKANPALVSQHVQSINQYFQDVANGTLPNVALIEPAYGAALDEHPTVNDQFPTRIQAGANYVSGLINKLMNSPSWKDSAFILTWDEGGGLYDHVPPYTPVSNPDGTPPNDKLAGDICTATPTAPTCDFTYTGFRVPLIVVSPFTKKNYVSHTPTDYTAILKLIETRFKVPNLTARDAASMDMTEFFDFVNVPWATPPSPPAQNTTATCDILPPNP